MAEGVHTEAHARKVPRKYTRRQIVTGAAKLTGLSLVGLGSTLVRRAVLGSDRQSTSQETLQSGSSSNAKIATLENVVVESPSKKEAVAPNLFDVVFHDLSSRERQWVRSLVDSYKRIIRSKEEYPQMLSVTKKYEQDIRTQCSQRGILPQSGIGIIFIENGGGEDLVNEESEARGVAQFLEDTGSDFGLRIDVNWRQGGVDERSDPLKSIVAMGKYLQVHKRLFADDEGLAIWSYHAGAGNVMAALQAYFWDARGVVVGSYGLALADNDPGEVARIEKDVKELIVEFKTDVHKVLANQAVQEIIVPYLVDFSQTYPYQAVAAAELFEEEQVITV